MPTATATTHGAAQGNGLSQDSKLACKSYMGWYAPNRYLGNLYLLGTYEGIRYRFQNLTLVNPIFLQNATEKVCVASCSVTLQGQSSTLTWQWRQSLVRGENTVVWTITAKNGTVLAQATLPLDSVYVRMPGDVVSNPPTES